MPRLTNLTDVLFPVAERPVFASVPNGAGDRHSLQRLAGHWLADFTKQCRTPDFNFSSYVEKFDGTLNSRASAS